MRGSVHEMMRAAALIIKGCGRAPAAIAVAGLVVVFALARADAREYIFAGHFMSSSSTGSSELFDVAHAITDFLAHETGDKFRIDRLSDNEQVKQAFIDGKADFAMLWPDSVVELKEAGAQVHPWATYRVKDRDKRAMCLWQRREDNIADARAVTGKTLLSDDFSWLYIVSLRDFLYRQGIDMPPWEVFGSFTKVPNQNSAFMAVAMNKADFFWQSDDDDLVLKLMSPALAQKLGHELCTDRVFTRATILMNGKTMSAAELKKYRDFVKNNLSKMDEFAKTDPNVKRITQFMKTLKRKFTPVMENEYETEAALYEKSKKNGWMREAGFIGKIMNETPPGKAVSIKPDYEYCSKSCAGAADKLDCIGKCLE